MTLGGFIGNLAIGPISKYLGRRHGLMIACLLSIASVGVMYSTSIGVLYFGRTLLGISIGLLGGFSQLWVLESMPFHLRGSMISFYTLWISIGGVIGRYSS
jgi:MFS transporter, SP family, sugar:H+ symporter